MWKSAKDVVNIKIRHKPILKILTFYCSKRNKDREERSSTGGDKESRSSRDDGEEMEPRRDRRKASEDNPASTVDGNIALGLTIEDAAFRVVENDSVEIEVKEHLALPTDALVSHLQSWFESFNNKVL